MKKKGIVSVVIMSCLLLLNAMDSNVEIYGSAISSEEEYEGADFEYPIVPGTEEWDKLGSVANKVAACRIPQDILSKMTNEQLIDAILDFPFLYDIFAYSTEEEGVKSLEYICDAYLELLNRDDAKDSLVETMNQRSKTRSIDQSISDEIKNDALSILILSQDDFEDSISEEDISIIAEAATIVETVEAGTYASRATYLSTPNDEDVLAYIYTCSHTTAYHRERDEEYAETYGVELIRTGTCKYNCHSYAWYSTSDSNSYWIPNPEPYMTDGSYKKVLSGLNTSSLNAGKGDVVVYGSTSAATHSALLIGGGTGEPLATRYVYSKWGALGVFKHRVSVVPAGYDTTTMSVWSEN